jgi:hypothetical protein
MADVMTVHLIAKLAMDTLKLANFYSMPLICQLDLSFMRRTIFLLTLFDQNYICHRKSTKGFPAHESATPKPPTVAPARALPERASTSRLSRFRARRASLHDGLGRRETVAEGRPRLQKIIPDELGSEQQLVEAMKEIWGIYPLYSFCVEA